MNGCYTRCKHYSSFPFNPRLYCLVNFYYWDNNAFTLLYSDEILEEYVLILDRLEATGKIKKRHADSLLKKIAKKGKKINIVSKLNISPDPKDNRYIHCAKDGRAHYLVTRDIGDLLKIGKYEYTQIISAKELLAILQDKDYS